MKNFSKEYIELCKSEKIQGLRPRFEFGDYLIYKDRTTLVSLFTSENSYDDNFDFADRMDRLRDDRLWLPTGDQLDQEIVKICKEMDWAYRVDVDSNYCWNTQCEIYSYDENEMVAETQESNPLIAKIKLLIQLLEVKGV